MTLITFQDGKVVLRDGAVGTEQACCCSGGGEEDCCCKCRVKVTFPGLFEDGEFIDACGGQSSEQGTPPCDDFVIFKEVSYQLSCDNNEYSLLIGGTMFCEAPDIFGDGGAQWSRGDLYTFGCDGIATFVSTTLSSTGDLESQCPCGTPDEYLGNVQIEIDCNPLP